MSTLSKTEDGQKMDKSAAMDPCDYTDLDPKDRDALLKKRLPELRELPPTVYDMHRKDVAKEFGIRVSTLDEEVQQNDNDVCNHEPIFPRIILWPYPVDGTALYRLLVQILERYVKLPDGAACAVALWVLHTYALTAAFVSPVLALVSPQFRCGKTTLLTILGALVRRPLPASNLSPAVAFRAIEKWQPTLLIDEADTFLRDNNELRGIINSGHTHGTARVLRADGENNEPRSFSTWGAKAIAKIGRLPGTLADRSISIPMHRKRRDEGVEQLRMDKLKELRYITRLCERWAQDNIDTIRDCDPDMPATLNDRAADNWRTLVSIAEVAGVAYEAHLSIRSLETEGQDDITVATMLLADIKALFKKRRTDRVSSESIIEHLTGMEERPWPEWQQGRPITKRQLARLLEPYEVRPKLIDFQGTKKRGYKIESFEDAFCRYVPTPPDQSVTPLQVNGSAGSSKLSSVTNRNKVTDEKTLRLNNGADCNGVMDENGETGKGAVLEL